MDTPAEREKIIQSIISNINNDPRGDQKVVLSIIGDVKLIPIEGRGPISFGRDPNDSRRFTLSIQSNDINRDFSNY